MPTTTRRRPILTATLVFVVIFGLICLTFIVLRRVFAPGVTRANAEMVFDAFDAVVKKGDVAIDDDKLAGEIAAEAFRKQTDSAPLDGWGHAMRVSATLTGDSCAVTVRSAGADNVFDTADDVVCEQIFDVSRKAGITGPPAAKIDN
jgi:hypothetical protein